MCYQDPLIQNTVEEIGNSVCKFPDRRARMKDEKNVKRIKDLEDKLLYQEVYSRRENLRFFGIPEATHDPEDTAGVLHKFFREELNIVILATLNFKESTGQENCGCGTASRSKL